MPEFKLHYYVRGNGDGSASVEFVKNKAEAEESPEAEEGWGESTASYVIAKIENDKLYFKDFQKNSLTGRYEYIWVEAEQ